MRDDESIGRTRDEEGVFHDGSARVEAFLRFGEEESILSSQREIQVGLAGVTGNDASRKH